MPDRLFGKAIAIGMVGMVTGLLPLVGLAAIVTLLVVIAWK